jgi:hypothetical protein
VLFPLFIGAWLTTLSITLACGSALLGEAILVRVLPRLASFRKRVDAGFELCEAVALRAGMLKRMSASHRGELEQIERLAGGIRTRCGHDGEKGALAAPALAVEHWLELERLLALYVQLAVAHGYIADSFHEEDGATLDAAIEEMKALASERRGQRSDWLEGRAAILQRRRETWMHAAHERDLIVQKLSTIVDLVRWMHEVCTVVSAGSVGSEFEDLLASWEANGETLREVSTLCRVDEELVNPAVLALGREEMARREKVARKLGVFYGESGPRVEGDPAGRTATPPLVPDPERCGKRDAASAGAAPLSFSMRTGPAGRRGGHGRDRGGRSITNRRPGALGFEVLRSPVNDSDRSAVRAQNRS